MDDTIDDLNGVLHIRDDFIVYGRSNKEHDEALESEALELESAD